MRKPISVLIKPASGQCNLACTYCFYTDIMAHHPTKNSAMMSQKTRDQIILKIFATNPCDVSFTFQGGEPTLAGLSFFVDFIECVRHYNINQVPIHYALQTNGYFLDETWASFFHHHHFLIGLSLDGVQKTHNQYRLTHHNRKSFNQVLKTIELFKNHHVEFNILTVVTPTISENIKEIYQFYRDHNLLHQQYIPVLDPLKMPRGSMPYSLTPDQYTTFLIDLFDCWYKDRLAHTPLYNHYFENLLGMLIGIPPNSCTMMGMCTTQLVIEADGSVYPCDFYVLDHYRLGNLNVDTLPMIEEKRRATKFIETSIRLDARCYQCKWVSLCRGGCKRERNLLKKEASLNYYCQSYQSFFAHAIPKLQVLIKKHQI